MARLWSTGFELNSSTNDVEWQSTTNLTIQTTTIRSGTYAGRFNMSGTNGWASHVYRASNTQEDIRVRFYLYIATAPSATLELFTFRGGKSVQCGLRMTTGRALQLYNFEDSAQIGSDSSALSTGQWYRIEIKQDTTTLASTAIDALIDGSSFASGTANLASASSTFRIGSTGSNTTDIYFDDIAINDTSGSFQNSWPGEGEIIHIRPSAAGDNAGWTRAGSDSGANWSQVDEVTPNDATDVNKTGTLDAIDDYNLDATPAALASNDTINCVQVGARFRVENNTGADPDVVFRIKASASGTVEESAAITATTNIWSTNAMAAPRNHPLALYDLPGASTTAWTKSDLDTTQIGARISTGDTHPVQLSTMWLLVDHKPTSGGGGEVTYISTRMMRGLG